MSVPICAVIVVLNEQGHVLVSSRRYDHTRLNLPGGKCDPEDGDPTRDLSGVLLACAERELREETGLEAAPGGLEMIHCGICVDEAGKESNAINFTYFAHQVTGTPLASEGEPPIRWVPWDDLLAHTPYRAYNITVGVLVANRFSLGQHTQGLNS